MLDTVIVIQTSESAARTFFFGLAIIGGVIGALLPPIGKIGRLAYFASAISIYGGSFAFLYAVGQSTDVALIYFGYIFIGVLTGVVTSWVARARSADIIGDGRYAYLAFIPFVALYLVFAGGRFFGQGVSKSDSTTTKNGLWISVIFGLLLTFTATKMNENSDANQFARDVAASIGPKRIDSVTRLIGAEADDNLIKIFHVFEGEATILTEASFEKIKASVCSDIEAVETMRSFGLEREFIYLDEDGELIGSFVADC